MAKIVGIEGMTADQVLAEVERGGKQAIRLIYDDLKAESALSRYTVKAPP